MRSSGVCARGEVEVGSGDPTVHVQESSKEGMQRYATMLGADYRLSALIGAGGMGSVYKGSQTRLNMPIAVKILRDVNDELSLKRFQKEAQVLACLAHPNIVRILSFHVFDNSECALVMEFADGKSLAQLLQARSLSISDCLDVVLQACDAVQYAHDNGVVHRDIKPSNIIVVRPKGAALQAKLVDFGIASRLHSGDQKLTRTGTMMGSPQYMSPEQCKAQPADHRSDIYSLGCILYEILAGRQCYEGDSALEVMYKHINETPAAAPGVSPVALELIHKAMAPDPQQRYQTVEQFQSALRAAISSGQLLSGSVRPAPPRAAFSMKRLGITTALVLAIAGVIGLFITMQHQQATRAPTVAQAEENLLNRYADRSLVDLSFELKEKWFEKGQLPPRDLIAALEPKAESTRNKDELYLVSHAYQMGAIALPEMNKRYTDLSAHYLRRTVDLVHQDHGDSMLDVHVLVQHLVKAGQIKDARHSLEKDVLYARNEGTRLFLVESDLELTAFLLMTNQPDASSYAQGVCRAYSAQDIADAKADLADRRTCFINLVTPRYPKFPYES